MDDPPFSADARIRDSVYTPVGRVEIRDVRGEKREVSLRIAIPPSIERGPLQGDDVVGISLVRFGLRSLSVAGRRLPPKWSAWFCSGWP